jgi:hypothetical protein
MTPKALSSNDKCSVEAGSICGQEPSVEPPVMVLYGIAISKPSQSKTAHIFCTLLIIGMA